MKQKLALELESVGVLDGIVKADAFIPRLKGYMFQKTPKSKGILFLRCNSLHSFFMHFAIDLYFLDEDMRLVAFVEAFEKNKTIHVKNAAHVLETPSGAIDKHKIQVGQVFHFTP